MKSGKSQEGTTRRRTSHTGSLKSSKRNASHHQNHSARFGFPCTVTYGLPQSSKVSLTGPVRRPSLSAVNKPLSVAVVWRAPVVQLSHSFPGSCSPCRSMSESGALTALDHTERAQNRPAGFKVFPRWREGGGGRETVPHAFLNPSKKKGTR